MARIGRRLSGSLIVQELSALARRGDRVLRQADRPGAIRPGAGGLRFRVDRPVIVDVAAPGRSVPFWLDDQGFRRVATPLRVAGDGLGRLPEAVPRRLGGAGRQRPRPHARRRITLVFVRSADAGARSPRARRDRPGPLATSCRRATATSAAFDRRLPIGPLPDDLREAVMLQPAHDRRHATLLARGRVWKTHVASGPTPDQVAVAFGLDPARSLAWTWRTAPEVGATALRLAPAGPGARGPDPSRRDP